MEAYTARKTFYDHIGERLQKAGRKLDGADSPEKVASAVDTAREVFDSMIAEERESAEKLREFFRTLGTGEDQFEDAYVKLVNKSDLPGSDTIIKPMYQQMAKYSDRPVVLTARKLFNEVANKLNTWAVFGERQKARDLARYKAKRETMSEQERKLSDLRKLHLALQMVMFDEQVSPVDIQAKSSGDVYQMLIAKKALTPQEAELYQGRFLFGNFARWDSDATIAVVPTDYQKDKSVYVTALGVQGELVNGLPVRQGGLVGRFSSRTPAILPEK